MTASAGEGGRIPDRPPFFSAEQVDDYASSIPDASREIVRTRICDSCGERKPLVIDHFGLDRDDPDGYRRVCKPCRKSQAERKQSKELTARLGELESAAMGAMLKLAGGAASSKLPHVSEVYEALMAAFGGAAGFARHFMANFLAADAGSKTRQIMLSQVVQIATNATKLGTTSRPVTEMSDEEIASEARERLHSEVQAAALRVLRIDEVRDVG